MPSAPGAWLVSGGSGRQTGRSLPPRRQRSACYRLGDGAATPSLALAWAQLSDRGSATPTPRLLLSCLQHPSAWPAPGTSSSALESPRGVVVAIRARCETARACADVSSGDQGRSGRPGDCGRGKRTAWFIVIPVACWRAADRAIPSGSVRAVGAAAGAVDVGRAAAAAAVAAPGLLAFFDRECGDGERDRGIGPPEAERGVQCEAREYCCGQWFRRVDKGLLGVP